jgi:membrane-associated phospholipid phosphatase
MSDFIPWGLSVVQWIQSFRNPFLDLFFQSANFLGEVNFYLAFVPLLYWCIHKDIGRRFGLLFIFSTYANLYLKDFFAQPRPYQVDANLYAPTKESSFGIPSFHSQGTTLTWGYLATQFKARWLWVLAVVIPVFASIGRMYVGVHFPQDVIAGGAIGLALFIAYAAFEPRVGAWFATRASLAIKLTAAILVPLALAAIHLTPDTGTAAGTLLGFSVGLVLEEEFVRFGTHGELWKQIAKLAIGGIVLLALQQGIKFFLPEAGVNNFIRYSIVALWLALGAPWVFVKAKIVEQITSPRGRGLG